MRYVIPCVEQLDRAARELRDRNPVNSRLALILTDNIVELICHRRCQLLIDWDGGGSWLDQPKFQFRERRRVLGRFFDQKIAFLQREGLVSEVEKDFVQIAHEYRNKAYHVGLRDDAIMWSLAWHYHAFACELFGRLERGWIGRTSTDPFTKRVKYHFEKTGTQPLFADFKKLAKSIDAERPPVDKPLGVVLSTALLEELEELERLFAFLVTDNPNKLGKNDILRNIQFHNDFVAEMEKAALFPSDAAYQTEARRVRKQMTSSWKPKYQRIPLDSWRRRAKLLAEEREFLKALKKFESVRAEKNYLNDVISGAASELDAYIQMRIDHARGK